MTNFAQKGSLPKQWVQLPEPRERFPEPRERFPEPRERFPEPRGSFPEPRERFPEPRERFPKPWERFPKPWVRLAFYRIPCFEAIVPLFPGMFRLIDLFHNCSVKSLMKVPEGQSFGNKLLMKKN